MRRQCMSALRAWPGAVMVSLALAGCGLGSSEVTYDERSDHGAPGEVLRVESGVLYYPACGNEILQWEGGPLYPFTPANLDEFPDDPIPGWADASASAGSDVAVVSAAYLPAVVAPGPGDDVGTLVTYEGALAYWESDSGDLFTWLTRDEITYAWIC